MSGGRYEPITFARRNWQQALDLPGACQMGHVHCLATSRPMLSRVPDQSILVEERSGAEHRRACRGVGYLFVYLPQGGAAKVNLESLRESVIRAWWYDPRTGEARDVGLLPRQDQMEFVAPWGGPCSDWVLVIDNATAKYPPPGRLEPHAKGPGLTI
jgi:hypothetical protein